MNTSCEEDDSGYCPIHPHHLQPCRVCSFERMIERADMERKRKKEEELIK